MEPKKLRIYVDTSVIGGCLDLEFAEFSMRLIEAARAGDVSLVASELLAQELLRAPEEVRTLFNSLPDSAVERVRVTDECEQLQNWYIERGIVGKASANDALHVAIATVNAVDAIASWNFRHIVHLDKIQMFNAVNTSKGYRAIEIRTPQEVV